MMKESARSKEFKKLLRDFLKKLKAFSKDNDLLFYERMDIVFLEKDIKEMFK